MIIDKKQKGKITIYTVEKDVKDDHMASLMNKHLKPSQIKDIINDDADVMTTDGKILLRFRKHKLSKSHISAFYDNVIDFAVIPTNNRGSAIGSKKKSIWDNAKIMTNIIGYFDKLSPRQKFILAQQGKTLKTNVRECRFNMDYPEKYKKLLPLVKEIDHYYQQYFPDKYRLQRKKADQTPFKIAGTSFTTITTNVNFQTSVHTDKGDDMDGFGNLSVIEHGEYQGGETCLPQYGIGVNVRTGDVLFMDVHQAHGNLPLKLGTKDAKRLSIVCYLRKNIWEKTKGKTKKFMMTHNHVMKNIRKTQRRR